jgi:hypothetical protein
MSKTGYVEIASRLVMVARSCFNMRGHEGLQGAAEVARGHRRLQEAVGASF